VDAATENECDYKGEVYDLHDKQRGQGSRGKIVVKVWGKDAKFHKGEGEGGKERGWE